MHVAEQFQMAAELIEEFTGDPSPDTVNNAYVTLCIHAGIAAADVVCCARLGEYSRGEDHKAASALLSSVDRALGRALERLLAMKTPAGYQRGSISLQHVTIAKRQADQLLRGARDVT